MRAARFRAIRETCGVSQAQVARAMGVREITVRRWESGRTPVPPDAGEWLLEAAEEHQRGVDEAVERIAGLPKGSTVAMTYYRSQEQADIEAGPGEAGPYAFLNAITRSAAERLAQMGYSIDYAYPDEERRYSGEVV